MSLMAEALRPRGITVLSLWPGNVNQNEVDRPTSIAGLRKLIAAATLEKAGTFTRYNGQPIAF